MSRVSGAKLAFLSLACCSLVYWYAVLTHIKDQQNSYEDPDEPFRSYMEPLQSDFEQNEDEAVKYDQPGPAPTKDAFADMRHFAVLSATYFANSIR